jgi:histidyl-tRNA synthetase
MGDTHNIIQFDITLARGLNYYTGCIYEVAVDLSAEGQENIKMGSIGGGGRYANLTENFGMKTNGSGVGVSFGAERIYDVMEELNLFPEDKANTLQLLFIAFDEKAHRYAFKALQQVRAAGINAELYPEPAKVKKQMKYANQRNVPYTVVIGDREMESGELALKNMATGKQEDLELNTIIDQLK